MVSNMEDRDVACDSDSVELDSNCQHGGDDCTSLDGNPKLADAISKVLRMAQKKSKNKSIILSKAKLYNPDKPIRKEKSEFEIEPNPDLSTSVKEEIDVKPDIKDTNLVKKSAPDRHKILKRGRIIPSISDREKDRKLAKIATKGVVQLFNAVRQQQSSIEKQLKENKMTETKREKIFKSIDRKAFLNALSGSVNISLKADLDDDSINKTVKEEEPDVEDSNENPSWEVLRNDFMMGAKLKDWDKTDVELSS